MHSARFEASKSAILTMTLTKPVEKPVMSLEQILSLLGAITDLHDLCLMHVGIFSGPRASEVMGFQWKSWKEDSLIPYGTTYEGQFYRGRLSRRRAGSSSRTVRPVIEAWWRLCRDPSPEALMFPTFGRGERKAWPYRVRRRTSSSGGSVDRSQIFNVQARCRFLAPNQKRPVPLIA